MRFTTAIVTLAAVAAAVPTAPAARRDGSTETVNADLPVVDLKVACKDYDKYFWCVENGCGPIGPDLCFPAFTCAIVWC